MKLPLYYVTLTVVGWIDVFTRKEYTQEFLDTLKYWQTHKGLRLYAYVVMSNRVHLILEPRSTKIADLIQNFKQETGERIVRHIGKNHEESRSDWLMHMLSFFGKFDKQNQNFQFWLNDDPIIPLTDETQLRHKIAHLHNRPVVQGIVTHPEHYLYSSANPLRKIKVEEFGMKELGLRASAGMC
jgi:putative transposase